MTRLPGWVERGGFVLALAAGAVNAIAILGFNHQGVSHLSGISTLLGIEASNGNAAATLTLTLALAAFVIGAAISGFLIGGEPFALSRAYTYCLFGETCLLVLSMTMLERGSYLGLLLASVACGLQNAMTSTFSSAIVRTASGGMVARPGSRRWQSTREPGERAGGRPGRCGSCGLQSASEIA